MELDRSGGHSGRNLGTSFEAGTAAAAKGLIRNDHTAGIGFVALAHAVHAGIDAGSAIEADLRVNRDVVLRKGLALFPDLLVKSGADDVEKSVELGAGFDLLDEFRDLLHGELEGAGQMFLELIEQGAMLEADLALLIAAAAMETEVEGQDLGELELFRLHRPLDGQEFSSGRERLVPRGPIGRTAGDTVSALGAGKNIPGDGLQPLRDHGNLATERLLGNDRKQLEEKPLAHRKLEIEDVRLEEQFLKGPQPA